MSLREKLTPTQLLAVAFAVMMLVSMGGVAFVGGAGAQTGGTYDAITEEERVINDTVNVDTGEVSILNRTDGTGGFNVTPAADGSILIEEDAGNTGIQSNEFAGVAVDSERVAALHDASADPDTESADFLAEVTDEYTIAGDNTGDANTDSAYPAVFIELDPQSEFSQITGDSDVAGSHDFIVVFKNADGVQAYSVNNDNVGGDNAQLVTNAATFGDAVDELVGADAEADRSESDLQNKNIDSIQFAAGMGLEDLGDSTVIDTPVPSAQVTDLRLTADDGTERFLHSEKITLEDTNGDQSFFASVSAVGNNGNAGPGALDEASSGDEIILDDGTYETFEGTGGPVSVGTDNVTITGANTAPGPDRVNDAGDGLADRASESIIGAPINAANADDVSLTGLAVEADNDPVINIGPGTGGVATDPSVDSAVVLQTGQNTGVTIDLDSESDALTFTDSAILSENNVSVGDGDTGLSVTSFGSSQPVVDISGNLFVGHQTQFDGLDSNDINLADLVSNNEFQDERAQAVIPVADSGNFDAATKNIYGSINAAAADNSFSDADVNELDVRSGTYEEDPTLDTQPVVTVSGADGAVIDGVATLQNADRSEFRNIDFAPDEASANTLSVTGAAADGTSVSDVTFRANVDDAEYSGTLDISSAAGDVSVSDVHAQALDGGDSTYGIQIIENAPGTGAGNVSIADSNLTVAEGDIDPVVDLAANGNNEINNEINATSVAVTDTTVDLGNADASAGIEIAVEDNAETTTDSVAITDNQVLNGGDGVGLSLTANPNDFSDDTGDLITLTNNEIDGGSAFEGVILDFSQEASSPEILELDGNVINGSDVHAGTGLSISVNKHDGDTDIIKTALDGNSNTITNFETLLDVAPTSRPSLQDMAAELTLGTHVDVRNADGEIPGAFASLNGNDGQLYGGIDNAVAVAGDTPDPVTATVTDTAVSATIDGEQIPATDYVHSGDDAQFTDAHPGVTLVGPGTAADDPIAEDLSLTLADGETDLSNHSVSDLRVHTDGPAGGEVIDVNSSNAQSTFTNLEVVTDATGLAADADDSDVNVLEVSNSSFDVGVNGLVLVDGADDRDGFIIDNVSLTGPGVGTDASTGVDLSGLDKPGKDDPQLDTEFTFTNNDVAGFETQLELDGSTIAQGAIGDSGTTVEAIVENDVNATNIDSEERVTIDNNVFEQAVLIYNETDGETDVLMERQTLYGSIDEADAQADNTDVGFGGDYGAAGIVDVRTPTGDTTVYNEAVTLGEANVAALDTVEIRGPQFNVTATDAPRGTEAVIQPDPGTTAVDVDAADLDNVTLDGVTVVGVEQTFVDEDGDVGDYGVVGGIVTAPQYVDNVVDLNSAETVFINHTAVSLEALQGEVDTTTAPDTLVQEPTAIAEPEADTTGVGMTAAADATLADVFVGDHTEVATTVDSVHVANGAGAGSLTLIDGDFAPGAADRGVGLNVSDSTGTTTVDVFTSTFADHGTDGVLFTTDDVTDASGDADVTLNATTVTDSGGDGVNITDATGTLTLEAGSEVSASDKIGVNVTDSGVDVTAINSDVSANTGEGIVFATGDNDAHEINATRIANNGGVGVNVTSEVDQATVDALSGNISGNSFLDNGASINLNTSTDAKAGFDATLNYYGDRNGPAADTADAFSGEFAETIIYDPFLTEDLASESDTAADNVSTTPSFGHDVIAPAPADGEARTFTSVGFPAEPEALGDAEVQDYFDTSAGNVYALENGSFTTVQPDTEIDAFDAFVVENRGDNGDRVVSVEYQDSPGAGDLVDNTYTFEEGVNFVAPQQAGQVDEVLFPGGDTDAVVQPFAAGENLYGDTDATQVRDGFVTPDSAQDVSQNFRSGAGDATVHPHVGYIVIVNEEANEGLEVTEKIPVPDGPTADNIAERTDANSDVAVTNAETGDTYESLTAALSDLNDYETLVLERGTFAQDRDELTITQDNVRLVGQGATQTEIAADLILEGSSIQVDAIDFVANSPTGKVTVLGAGASLNNVNAEGGLSIEANRTSVTGGSASSITVSSTGNSISGTQTSGITVNDGASASISDIQAAPGTVVNADTGANYDTIQAAVDADGTDETISVGAGTFNEQVVIDRDSHASGLTIEAAEGPDATTVSYDSDGGEPTVAVDQDGITLDGFTVERTGSSNVAQAVRVAGSDVTLTDNAYSATGSVDAAVGVLTGSSGAAGNPDVSGETFDNIEISGGEITDSTTGLLVADNGAASFNDNAVSVTGVSFANNGEHVLGLETSGNAVDATAVLNDNTFDSAEIADASQEDPRDRFSVDTLIRPTE